MLLVLWLLFEKVSILLFFFSGSMGGGRGWGGVFTCLPPFLSPHPWMHLLQTSFGHVSPPPHLPALPRVVDLLPGLGRKPERRLSVTYRRTAARDTDFACREYWMDGAKASGAHRPMLCGDSSHPMMMASVMMVIMRGARVVVSSCVVSSQTGRGLAPSCSSPF